jgi:hypothetical protein
VCPSIPTQLLPRQARQAANILALRPIRDSPAVFRKSHTSRGKSPCRGESLMPQYTPNTSIAPPWSASMSMQASIVLDQPGNVSFTNLDVISGRVVVRCSKSVDITTIVVKLEGESRTRLMSAGGPDGERPKPQLEYHKVRNSGLLIRWLWLITIDSLQSADGLPALGRSRRTGSWEGFLHAAAWHARVSLEVQSRTHPFHSHCSADNVC